MTKLRSFLEARVEDCYRRNVAKIVPLLQSELCHAESKLEATDAEIKALSIDRLKNRALKVSHWLVTLLVHFY